VPLTYKLIASTITTVDTGPVSFTSIPATYTDLILVAGTRSAASATSETLWLQINDDTGGNYTYSRQFIVDSTVYKGGGSGNAQWFSSSIANSNMANMFAYWNIYIPEYTSGNPKTAAAMNAFPSNNQAVNSSEKFGYTWDPTSVINKITIKFNGPNFVAGSSFFLYGINKS